MGKIRDLVLSTLAAAGVVTGALTLGNQVEECKQADTVVEENIEYMDVDDSYYLENVSTIGRYEIRNVDTSRPVVMYIDSADFTEIEFNVIQDILANLNEVFEKMNSDIRFQAAYGEEVPNFQIFDANSIVCQKSFTIDSSAAASAYINRDLLEIKYNFEAFHKFSHGAAAFLHETMHFMGFGDAYSVEGNTTPSVMHALGSDYQTPFLSVNDMKMLASLYGHFETEQDWLNFLAFAEEKESADLQMYDKLDTYLRNDRMPRMGYLVARKVLTGYVPESYFEEKYAQEMAEFSEKQERLFLEDILPESYFEERFGGKEK